MISLWLRTSGPQLRIRFAQAFGEFGFDRNVQFCTHHDGVGDGLRVRMIVEEDVRFLDRLFLDHLLQANGIRTNFFLCVEVVIAIVAMLNRFASAVKDAGP